jgi:hypothetical protein
MRILEGDKYKPYAHQISRSSSCDQQTFCTDGFQTAVAQCRRSERAREGASLEEPAYYSSYTYLMKIQVMSLVVESVAQDSFRGSGVEIESM